MGYVILVFAIAIYMVPTMIACDRKHSSKLAIAFVNIFFGWTVLGYLVSFVWSLANTGNRTVIVYVKQGEDPVA
jgi:hypothetical protein